MPRLVMCLVLFSSLNPECVDNGDDYMIHIWIWSHPIGSKNSDFYPNFYDYLDIFIKFSYDD
jgi:hypothetical protein